jgi:hypothetical protein
MARFRLMEKDNQGNKIGPHSMGPVVRGRFSKRFVAGSIIESDQPLDQVFRGKFVKLDDGPSPEPAEPKPSKGKSKRK